MILSINPSYYCNFRCDFCYLTNDQLSDKRRLDLDTLKSKIEEVKKFYSVQMVDLYGGEPFMLPRDYIMGLKEVLTDCDIDDVNVVTNLSVDSPFIHDEDFYLTVSYDFDGREKHEEVFNRMLSLNRPFSILVLCTPYLVKLDIDHCIRQLNLLSNLVSVEIKPYSSNQANALPVRDDEFESVVKRFIESPVKRNFDLINIDRLESVLAKTQNAFSDDHLYLTPNGKFAVLDFDNQGREYFLELDTITDYVEWTNAEKRRISANPFCSNCEFMGHCLSEHLRDVSSLDNSCNGFYKLIRWYKDERVEKESGALP